MSIVVTQGVVFFFFFTIYVLKYVLLWLVGWLAALRKHIEQCNGCNSNSNSILYILSLLCIVVIIGYDKAIIGLITFHYSTCMFLSTVVCTIERQLSHKNVTFS